MGCRACVDACLRAHAPACLRAHAPALVHQAINRRANHTENTVSSTRVAVANSTCDSNGGGGTRRLNHNRLWLWLEPVCDSINSQSIRGGMPESTSHHKRKSLLCRALASTSNWSTLALLGHSLDDQSGTRSWSEPSFDLRRLTSPNCCHLAKSFPTKA